MLTLKTYRDLFYAKYRAWLLSRGVTSGANVEDVIPKEQVDEYLNLGWARVAEENRVIDSARFHGLTSDPEIVIPNEENIFVVERIEVYRDGKLVRKCTIKPKSMLPADPDSETPGIPTLAAWSLTKHKDAPAELEIRLSPPANWDDDEGLFIYSYCRPDWLSDDDVEPEFPFLGMGKAGLNDALLQVTQDSKFNSLYEIDLQPLYASGLTTQGGMKSVASGTRPPDRSNLNSL